MGLEGLQEKRVCLVGGLEVSERGSCRPGGE